MLHEVLYLFGDVEYDYDADDDKQGDEEGRKELLHYVAVKYFRLQAHFYILWLTRFTACSFQAAKSPASMWARAWRTTSR